MPQDTRTLGDLLAQGGRETDWDHIVKTPDGVFWKSDDAVITRSSMFFPYAA